MSGKGGQIFLGNGTKVATAGEWTLNAGDRPYVDASAFGQSMEYQVPYPDRWSEIPWLQLLFGGPIYDQMVRIAMRRKIQRPQYRARRPRRR